jgi:cell shape-determining protein MreC
LPRAAAFEALSGFLLLSPERDDVSIFSWDAQSCSSALAFQYSFASIPCERKATTVNALKHFGQFKRTPRAVPLLAIILLLLSD